MSMTDYYFEEPLNDSSQSKHSAWLDTLFLLNKYVLNKLNWKFYFIDCLS